MSRTIPPSSVTPITPAPLPQRDADESTAAASEEIGGRGGLDPTRYGDWEKNGRCIDF